MVKRLYRTRSSRMIGGVCGGLAEYFNLDPTVIRLLMLLFGLAMGGGLIFYLACWFIIPEGPINA